MAIQWTRVIPISLVLVVAALVAWEAVGLDGNLALLPSDMLRTARVFCVKWAVWLGTCVYDVAHWIYDNTWWMFRRIIHAAANLIGESCSFVEVPYAFVCTALGNAYEWVEVTISPWFLLPPFFATTTILVVGVVRFLFASFPQAH
jgi:hypothetical protein